MNVAIAGLGLIGGSAAKAYHEAGHVLYGLDHDQTVLGFAQLAGVVDVPLDQNNIRECDCLLIALPPSAAIAFLQEWAPYIPAQCLVMDFCGTKRAVCERGFALAQQYGFTFVGGHPMAGSHHSGYAHSRADLFANASMIVVPPVTDDMAFLDNLKKLLEPLHLRCLTMATAEEHDKNIAFTSQLAHVVSNAYIKSPTAGRHKGFSAGSYRDLTRVAWLAPDMWTELFLENKDNLMQGIDTLIAELTQYRDAMERSDYTGLRQLLDDGRRRKGEVDGWTP